MKPIFKNIDIYAGFHPQNGMKKPMTSKTNWNTGTDSGEAGLYERRPGRHGASELCCGIPPYLRSVLDHVYVPSSGLSTVQDFLQLKNRMHFIAVTWLPEQKGLSVAFDLPTHRGYEPDIVPQVLMGDVGKAGVSICSLKI